MVNKRIILLTGAGFTANFGGLLAEEIWSIIFNQKEIQNCEGIRSLLTGRFNYEEIYQGILNNDSFDNNNNSFDIHDKNIIKNAVLGLPSASRAVIILREFENLSYREIAETLNIPIGTVMSRLNYARKQLRKSLSTLVEVA